MHAPSTAPRVVNYRTYKHFNEDDFTQDIAKAPFQVGEIFDDIDDKIWFYNNLLINVIETHAPMKRKLIKCKQVPYMNGKLRKAINVKAMLRRKFDKYRTDTAWFKYKAQRNLATNMKLASIRQYFAEQCSNTSRDFWITIQPFMSDKHENKGRHISILEDNRIISNDNEVCNVFNDFFVNMASNLSEPCHIKDIPTEQLIDYYDDHPSIRMIRQRCCAESAFRFEKVSPTQVLLKLKGLKTNKAYGYDLIPAKLLKMGANALCTSLTPIINHCISMSVYPDQLKRAEVSPIYKKDMLIKDNYRPVSILTALSKIVEGIMCDQLMTHFRNILSTSLSAYRKQYSCSNVLLKCVEEWKHTLDNNEAVGCILMDLSKAFDSIPMVYSLLSYLRTEHLKMHVNW